MSTPPTELRPVSARRAAIRRWWWLPATLLLFAGLLGGWWLWPRAVPPPPVTSTSGLDSEVADAIEQARRQVVANLRSADAWGQLGTLLFAHEIYGDSVTCLRQAEALDGNNMRWPYLQGLALLESEPDRALACLRRAAALAGGEFVPHLRLAEALLLRDQQTEAEQEFRQTLKLHPGNPRAILGLGRIALQRGQMQESLSQLLMAADNPVSRQAAHATMAEVYRRMRDDEAAARTLERTRTLPPDPPWPDPLLREAQSRATGASQRLDRARALWKAGNVNGSMTLIQENLRKQPRDADALALLGAILFDQQNRPAAKIALEEAVRLNPGDGASHLLLGGLHFQEKRLDAAAEAFAKAAKLMPASSEAAFNLSQCLQQKGDRAGAIAVLRTGLRYRPDAVALHSELGALLLQDGQPAEALAALQQARLLAPGDTKIQKLLDEARRLAAKTP
jgi:tetratricopeptide (TPR) repeat protein